jgi:uncharacterized protein (DUF58 family)
MATTATRLFDADFLHALEALHLAARRVPAGGRHAEQRSRARGAGIEFTDVRPYVAGDDFRSIDWPLLLRLDKVFLRLYLEDQDLPIHFLLDQSASMANAHGGRARSDIARQAVAALAYVALNQLDRVAVHPIAAPALEPLPGLSGKQAFHRLLGWLEALPARGTTPLVEGLEQFAQRRLRRGLCVLVSDLFDPRGIAAVLAALEQVRHHLLILRPVHPDERRPQLAGELEVVDCETGERLALTADDALLDRYEQAYSAFEQQVTTFAAHCGASHVALRTDQPIVPQIATLFRAGVLAVR